MTETIDQDYVDAQTERYADSLKKVAGRLRDIAERVEREGKPTVGHLQADGLPDYLWAAQQVVHEIHWGLANAHVDTLLSSAADAHSAVRGRIK